MRKILLLITSLLIVSCSNDSESTSSKYAMTALIDGKEFKANTPFGDNLYADFTIWNYFPSDDYILLQARAGGVFGNPEINIWLKKTDIVIGTYNIGKETFSTPSSHFIDLTDTSDEPFEYTKEGIITITDVNPNTKKVKGTFSFKTIEDIHDDNAPITHTITNGTFNYVYTK